jgi:peptidoglycan/xylan/chitin deacetylase (PgdA/CDA1 family)
MIKDGGPLVAILGYHKIGDPPGGWWTWSYVSEATFAAQLCYLRDHGWVGLDADTFIRALDAPELLPDRSVLITFDDGYRSLGETALPHLAKYDYPSILFVPTDYVGGPNRFDAGVEPEEAIAGWSDLVAFERAGMSVQSHGCSHRRLSQLSAVEQREEIVRSKDLLEQRLEKSITLFSYPYGDDGQGADAVRHTLQVNGYGAAFTYPGSLTALRAADRFRLERIAVGPDTNLDVLLNRDAVESPLQ